MTMTNRCLLFAVLLTALAPAQAFALTNFGMPFTGRAYLGMWGGSALMGTSANGGATCIWTPLGSGELDQDTQIVGTEGADVIFAPPVNVTWCGRTLTPLDTDGHVLVFDGRGGGDTLDGGIAATAVLGGTGADGIVLGIETTTVHINGGSGNDFMMLRSEGSFVLAGSGDDKLCIANAWRFTSGELNGGPNNTASPGDHLCGSAWSAPGWETRQADACSMLCPH